MPKSRRDKTIHLTRTKPKGLENKQGLVEKIRTAVDEHSGCFVFTVENMQNRRFKELRERLKPTTKIFMGKNRIMALALGRNEEEEYANCLHKFSTLLRNQRGLMFTNQDKDEVLKAITDFEATESTNDVAATESDEEEEAEPLKKGLPAKKKLPAKQRGPFRINTIAFWTKSSGEIELMKDE